MLQNMLKDTFKLSMHDEKRPMQVYVLQLASAAYSCDSERRSCLIPNTIAAIAITAR